MFLYNGEQSYSYADLLKAVCMDDYVPYPLAELI